MINAILWKERTGAPWRDLARAGNYVHAGQGTWRYSWMTQSRR
ncbi:hypothetical protein [Lentzea fradiae]